MPNLKPPVTTTAQAAAYRDRIVAARPAGSDFTPLMTLYLTDNTDAAEIARAAASGFVHAVKYYPMGATTNSDAGVTALSRVYPALAAMEKHGVVLSLHGEVTDADVDMFDRERVFVDRLLQRIVGDFPALRIVLEHITTREAAESSPARPPTSRRRSRRSTSSGRATRSSPAACVHTSTACRSSSARRTARRWSAQQRRAAPGSSSAPTARRTPATPRNTPAAAPLLSAHAALELYAEAFEDAGAIDRLEGFASFHGRTSTACRATATRSPSSGSRGACRPSTRSAPTPWCRCVPAKPYAGASPPPHRPDLAWCGCYPSHRSQPDRRRPLHGGGRKVRAPQSRMPGNTRTL